MIRADRRALLLAAVADAALTALLWALANRPVVLVTG